MSESRTEKGDERANEELGKGDKMSNHGLEIGDERSNLVESDSYVRAKHFLRRKREPDLNTQDAKARKLVSASHTQLAGNAV